MSTAPQQHYEFVPSLRSGQAFAPARILFPQRQHRSYQLRAPLALAHPMRPVGAILEAAWILRIKSPCPAIESLAADTKVAADTRYVAPVAVVVVKPLEALLCCLGQGCVLSETTGPGMILPYMLIWQPL